MIKGLSYFCFLVIIIVFSGCSYQKDSFHQVVQPTGNIQEEKTGNGESKNISYYGDWKITKDIGYGPASVYDQNDINHLIGKVVTYSESNAGIAPDDVKNPYYKETKYTNNDFLFNYNVKFENLGIESETIELIEIYLDKNLKNYYLETGGTFFLTEKEDKLIMFDQGVFFEMERIKK